LKILHNRNGKIFGLSRGELTYYCQKDLNFGLLKFRMMPRYRILGRFVGLTLPVAGPIGIICIFCRKPQVVKKDM